MDQTVKAILLSPPDVSSLEEEYVGAAIRSGWAAPAGPDLAAFEREMADRVGIPHAVGLSSGTAALHLTLVHWGVGQGDVVPVSTLTFAATVNAIRYVGAEPHLVDSDAATGNISAALLGDALAELEKAGRRVPAVIPVDLFGKVADYDALVEVAGDIPVLSDAAEAVGATSRGRPAGSFGDAAVFSFNGNKIMTTSGGGMLLTRDGDLADHVRKLSTQAREPVAHYEHTEVGYNYRLSNLLAAFGRAQLARLDGMMKQRRLWRERYRALVADLPGVEILGGADDAEDNCWLTALLVDSAQTGWSVNQLGDHLATAHIETRPTWKPMHAQPVFAGVSATLDGTADRIFEHGITMPSGSGMTNDEFDRIEHAIRDFLCSSTAYDPVKRVIDVVVAAVGLVVTAPVQVVVALAVLRKLGSPVFFRQLRPGRDEQIFELVKFRTMSVTSNGPTSTATDAERLTSFGAALRATSLDELPTLWNVLKGDMSLVGPRPLLIEYLDRYSPRQRRRHEVRPGITGLAQVSGRNALSWEERFAYDIEYVDQRSLGLDVNILRRTFARVLRREGITDAGGVSMAEFGGDGRADV